MCLAIVKPAYASVPEEHLAQGFFENPDGAGFAYSSRGKLVIKKGFFALDEFLEAWSKVRDSQNALVHFRIATSGSINKFNCHPWALSDKLAMIHNGILPWPASAIVSDTGKFVLDVLIPNEHRVRERRFQRTIEEVIGERNKMAFLSADGKITIYNEASGHWRDGVWYSNTSYLNWREFDEFTSTDELGYPAGSAWADEDVSGIDF